MDEKLGSPGDGSKGDKILTRFQANGRKGAAQREANKAQRRLLDAQRTNSSDQSTP
jgi:hypothetical protein